MITLKDIEQEIGVAIKAKNHLAADTLRGLKTRLQNEQIAKMSGKDAAAGLSEDQILALVRSEVKRRKEAAVAFTNGGRQELADKELQEAAILEKFLPPQLDESVVSQAVDKILAEGTFTVKDFGSIMGKLKIQLGSGADSGLIAKLLKEKLK